MAEHHAVTRRTLQQLKLSELRAMARDQQLPSTGQKSAVIDRLYRHGHQAVRTAGHSPDPSSADSGTATRRIARNPRRSYRAPTPDETDSPLPLFTSEPPATRQTTGDFQRSSRNPNLSPPNARVEASTASLERTVQLMVDQSMKDLEDRLLRSLRPLPLVDAGNISLPSPSGLPPPQPGVVGNSANVDNDDFTQAHADADNAPAVPLRSPTPLPPVPQKVRQRIVQGSTLNLILCYAKHCSQRGTARAPPPRCHSAYRTAIRPREKW